MPQYGFAGLNDGDQWCVMRALGQRWRPDSLARRARARTSQLEFVDLDDLKSHAVTS
jgi:uncharacterized protein (DUF2237 family)